MSKNLIKGIATSMRNAAASVMTLYIGFEEQLKTIVATVFSPEWVSSHWAVVGSVVAIGSYMLHLKGSTRQKAKIPYEERYAGGEDVCDNQ